MCCETPDLASAVTLGITTRDGGEGVLEASPWPIAILGVRRSLDTDQSLAKADPNDPHKNGLQAIEYKTLTAKAGTYLKQLSPCTVFNVLAMAAAKLSSNPSKDELFGVDTLTDMFNTCLAAFSLARFIARDKLKKKYATIHSGLFGAGAFHNNTYAAYVIQGLAAEQLDVDLHYWGVDPNLVKGAGADYDAIKSQYNAKGKNLSDLIQIASDVMKNPPKP